ncbi:MAG: tetratricopeptide repeat protein [Bacteroidetes bacterium]|nr:tetratricopeptide repeat protein [Bacteroidota bacterium]
MLTRLTLCATAALMLLASSGCRNETGHAAQSPDEPAFAVPDLKDRPAGLGDAEFAKVRDMYIQLKGRIISKNRDVEACTRMAQLFMNEARITGRHHDYIPGANALLDEALRRSPNDFEALVTKGSLLMTQHQFKPANDIALRAVAGNPYSALAYGVLCDSYVELGNYDAAVKACDAMMKIRPDLRSYARVSYIRELHGDRDGAIAAMKMAGESGAYGQEDREWCMYNLGNLFLNAGKPDTAAYIFNGILQERPNYPYALSGLAAVKNVRGDYTGAIELLVQALQISPEHLFSEQLSDVYLAMGESDNVKTLEAKVLEAFRLHEKGGWNVDREYAQYCGNHGIQLPEALERARREYDRRPDNIDAETTYAWLLFRNGRAAEAVPYIERALRLGAANPMLHYYAGSIYMGAGNRARGAAELKLALHQNPWLAPVARTSARRQLTERQHAGSGSNRM